jgi:hypothetical protein
MSFYIFLAILFASFVDEGGGSNEFTDELSTSSSHTGTNGTETNWSDSNVTVNITYNEPGVRYNSSYTYNGQ